MFDHPRESRHAMSASDDNILVEIFPSWKSTGLI
jgi:hypothetical protein